MLFKETISKAAEAEAKYVRHLGGRSEYAHVKIRVAPLTQGGGVRLQTISTDFFPKEYFLGVEQGLISALASGPVGRYEVTDLDAQVIDGSYHEVDSNLRSFAVATEEAVRKAVQAAEPYLLELLMRVSIAIPEEFMGAAIGELNSRDGRILGLEHRAEVPRHTIIEALVPERNKPAMEEALARYTQARERISSSAGGYQRLPASIASQMRYCSGCERKVLPTEAALCPDCGSALGSGDDMMMV